MKVYHSLSAFKDVNNPIATIGTFDGVHIGHQKIINRLAEIAKEEQGEVVLLTFHPHPRMVLQPDSDLKLINTQQEKIRFLEEAGIQHLIVLPFTREFSRISSIEYVRDILVNAMQVKKLVIGYDHHFGRNREGDFELLMELAGVYGFQVEEIPAQMLEDVKVSSTKIRKALADGDVETAASYLQRPFTITGRVVEGKHIGRSIGFPTANIRALESYKLVPGDGVYAVMATVDGRQYKGMMNIGMNPTVNSRERSMEVHLLDFEGDIYGEEITLELISRIRDEQKFESLEALKQRLSEDLKQTKVLLEAY